MNIVCWGTLYQLCIEVPDAKAETIMKTFLDRWIRYFGPPVTLVCDQGPEFFNDKINYSLFDFVMVKNALPMP